MGTPKWAPSSGELDELTLVRVQRGDEAACRALVLCYQRRVFALLGRMLGPSGRSVLVEDLAQEAFLRVFRGIGAFDRRGPGRLSTWVLTIATRLALDELKRAAPTLVDLGAETLALGAPARTDRALLDREVGAAIARAVGDLEPEFRATFLLREVHELSTEEVAKALGVDVGTVKSRLSRAKAALRRALGEVHDA
jgi:RNA polymerase sigma-70 factor (ECF subfamily)